MPAAIVELLETRRLLSANLVGELVGHVPSALALPALPNQLHARVTNEGHAVAKGPVTVSLFASADATLDSSDLLLASVTRAVRVQPGKGAVIPLRFKSPTTLADGEYFLLTKVDIAASSTVTVSASPVAIQSPFSDLAVSFASLPNRPVEIDGASAGGRGTLIRIVNTGNVTASGSVQVNLYMSSDAVLDGSDPLLATLPARSIALKAGQSRAFGLQIAVPPGTVVGGYFLFATLSQSGFTESNASNNVAITPQRVAIIDKLPRPRIVRQDIIVYYDGPDYVDDCGEYGYFSDTYITPPEDQTPPPVDQSDDGSQPPTDTGSNPSAPPSDGNGSDNSTTQPSDPGTNDPPTTAPTTQPTDPPTTQPSDPPTSDPSTGDNDGSNGATPVDSTGSDSPTGVTGGSSDSSDGGDCSGWDDN